MQTVAVVEDDPGMLEGLNRLLLAHGFGVERYTSAESFLEGKSEADCLLLDVHLGGISGIELQRRLASRGVNLPVIFMTAIENEIARQEAVEVGCVAFLRKPFRAKLLFDAIESILGRAN